MAPYDEVFIRLQAGEETRKIARSLHRRASLLTKQGSGRSLGQGHSALSAICAFLASKRLGNDEVTREQACAVACVDPKTFDSTLSVVESALHDNPPSPRLTQLVTYQSLLKQFGAREDAFVPMLEVEEMLRGCGVFVDENPTDLKSPLMQCAIFYWVCTVVLNVMIPDAQLRQMVKASSYKWSASQRFLEQQCSHMVEDLARKAKTAISGRKTRSQMQLRTKPRAMEEESENESAPNETIVVQRTRSLRKQLNRSAWDLQKPTSTAVKPVTPTSIRDSPSGAIVTFDDTPMTSTGMSDMSSPATSLSRSRTGPRARLHVPSAAKKVSFLIHEDEEMPRRRRRNLRAAFLNPGVYGWKPTAYTSKKLERARKWELLMIGKYGDPWDTW